MEAKIEKIRSNLTERINPLDGNDQSEKIKYELNSKNSNILEENIPNNELNNTSSQAENTELTNRKKSSDSTSVSISQNENLSQTSESSINNHNSISNNIIQKDKKDEEEINYFVGSEDYFFKIMPSKFSEYKKTRNYLPKNKVKQDEEKNLEKTDDKNSIKENGDENNIKNNQYIIR